MKKSFSIKDLCLPLAVMAGLFIVFGAFNIQGYLSAGDHGRDLYAFERTMHGDMAYRDYWWVYGPLMPFYYALFMKLYGVSIMSVLIGKAILKLSAGLLIFLAVSRVAHPAAALLGAVWFYLFSQEFFFTYNHIGGILCITGIAAMLLSYVKDRDMRWLWAAAFISFILCFIKLNFGLAGLAATALGAFITDLSYGLKASPNKKLFYRMMLIYLPLLTAAIYFSLLNGLNIYEIRQCMPYANDDHPYNSLPWVVIAQFWGLFVKKFFTSPLDFFFGCVVIVSLTRIAYLAWHERLKAKEDLQHLIALALLGMYFIFNFHEYLKNGTWYSSLWSQPLAFMFFFIAISLATRTAGRVTRVVVFGLIATLAVMGQRGQAGIIAQIKVPSQFLDHPRAQVFLINTPVWTKAVTDTADFLEKNLKSGEQFFALPYDPIYYYLTGRKSPTQLLIYFEHINIKEEQQRRIIADLEQKHIRWIVISSRMKTSEPGLGTFGLTYCPLIAKYFRENFDPVTEFGDWQNDGGWASSHGTVILRRRE
jgi:hypothetical protein